MKKIVNFILLLSIILTPSLSYADWEIVEDSMEYFYQPSGTLVGDIIGLLPQDENNLELREIESAIKSIERRIPLNFDFRIHIMDFSYSSMMVSGLIYNQENIIIFDYLPFKSRILTHDVVAHEIGHLVYNRFSDWEKGVYKFYRNIPDDWTNDGEYTNRPSEIFAEDFRILFGSRHARELSHFNKILPSPEEVDGLEELIEIFNKR